MRVVLQRSGAASVTVDGRITGAIEKGYVLLVGITHEDTKEDADYIAFFTPVYNNFFPAPLKAVIDRFQRYYSARFKRGAKPPIAKPKRVGVVIVSGSNARQCADYMTATLRQSFTVLNGEVTARYYIPGTDRGQYTFNNIELQKFIHQLRGEGAGR